MPRVFADLPSFSKAVGEHLGYSEWRVVSADDVLAFADVTGDHQWIHVDPVRAAAGPFGVQIAHGFFVLALVPEITAQVFQVRGLAMAVNYGLNKVRFPAPTPVGGRVRGGVQLSECTEVDGGVQAVMTVTITVEGAPKPSCVAESVVRFYPALSEPGGR
jgi:acyl dehydratase